MDSERLEYYFIELFPEIISEDEMMSLLYVVEGIRPGALIMSIQNRESSSIRDFCEEFDLETRVLYSEKEGLDDKGLFIARDPERFEILEESEGYFYGCSDTDVGRFLGYNMESVDYYEEHRNAGKEYRNKISELIDQGKITTKETAYLNLICYVPVPKQDQILRAVARGKKRAEKLREFDEEHGANVGEKLLDRMLDKEAGEIY